MQNGWPAGRHTRTAARPGHRTGPGAGSPPTRGHARAAPPVPRHMAHTGPSAAAGDTRRRPPGGAELLHLLERQPDRPLGVEAAPASPVPSGPVHRRPEARRPADRGNPVTTGRTPPAPTRPVCPRPPSGAVAVISHHVPSRLGRGDESSLAGQLRRQPARTWKYSLRPNGRARRTRPPPWRS
jgi:hypothetical protein